MENKDGLEKLKPLEIVTTTDESIKLHQVKTNQQMVISRQLPRQLNLVENNCCMEAVRMAEGFYYQWKAGDKTVSGITYQGALMLARNWQNCSVDSVGIDGHSMPTHFIITAVFTDFENNFNITRSYSIRKNYTIHGRYDEARKEDMRIQIAQSKALRNAILSGLPEWLKSKAEKHARSGVRKRIEDYISKNGKVNAIKLLVEGLNKNGVKTDIILAKFGKAKIEGLDIENLVTMKGDLSAIENGDEFAHNLYEFETKSEMEKRLQQRADELKKKKEEVKKEESENSDTEKQKEKRRPGRPPKEDKSKDNPEKPEEKHKETEYEKYLKSLNDVGLLGVFKDLKNQVKTETDTIAFAKMDKQRQVNLIVSLKDKIKNSEK